jgi:hypothetical protein
VLCPMIPNAQNVLKLDRIPLSQLNELDEMDFTV